MNEIYYKEALELTTSKVKDGDELRLQVLGVSMKPLLTPGDSVVVRVMVPSQLSKGDIVVVKRKSDFVTHRYLFNNINGWYTKGDNVHYGDIPVSGESILGKVIAIQRENKIIHLNNKYWRVLNFVMWSIGITEYSLFGFFRMIGVKIIGDKNSRVTLFFGKIIGFPFKLIRKLLFF